MKMMINISGLFRWPLIQHLSGLGIGKGAFVGNRKVGRDRGANMVTLNSGIREERQWAHEFYSKNGFVDSATGIYKNLL
ncbi:hypothetical protein TMU01_18000 [Tenuibacillus multivorans]|nr:hypothetical protein [Tenuibacillus multivorans]GEL77565.1 hypothetical protein TMU01_18000 [Tenuibacillus multivorans]